MRPRGWSRSQAKSQEPKSDAPSQAGTGGPRDSQTASLTEMSALVQQQWQESKECDTCSAKFTMISKRKYMCSTCGGAICNHCSKYVAILIILQFSLWSDRCAVQSDALGGKVKSTRMGRRERRTSSSGCAPTASRVSNCLPRVRMLPLLKASPLLESLTYALAAQVWA
jgi:hypothetical protein